LNIREDYFTKLLPSVGFDPGSPELKADTLPLRHCPSAIAYVQTVRAIAYVQTVRAIAYVQTVLTVVYVQTSFYECDVMYK